MLSASKKSPLRLCLMKMVFSWLRSSVWLNFGSTSLSGRVVKFGVIEDLRKCWKLMGRIAAFVIERIQGAAWYGLSVDWMACVDLNRIVEPPRGYLKEYPALCRQHDVLFIVDDI